MDENNRPAEPAQRPLQPKHTHSQTTIPKLDLAKLSATSRSPRKGSSDRNNDMNDSNSSRSTSRTRQPMSTRNRNGSTSGNAAAAAMQLMSPPSSQSLSETQDVHMDVDGHGERAFDLEMIRQQMQQDPARMLISPPPEEELLMRARRVSWVWRRRLRYN